MIKYKTNKGFTLIELIVSISIFLTIMTVSMGSIVGVFDANRKSRTLRAAITNLNLAVESMSKEMRFGHTYACTPPAGDCPGGDTQMGFTDSENRQVFYRFNNGVIEKSVNGGNYIGVTAPEVIIDDLTFYVLNSQPISTGDTNQPKVLIKIQSHAGTGRTQTNFTLQTLVSQRTLDY